mmetsp:Transcript_14417/g.31198  ORF Transcript_14417/g.31198 Transcript_14417/m.31198 type:complete len:233 (+) Transcript_14417:70-768(+)
MGAGSSQPAAPSGIVKGALGRVEPLVMAGAAEPELAEAGTEVPMVAGLPGREAEALPVLAAEPSMEMWLIWGRPGNTMLGLAVWATAREAALFICTCICPCAFSAWMAAAAATTAAVSLTVDCRGAATAVMAESTDIEAAMVGTRGDATAAAAGLLGGAVTAVAPVELTEWARVRPSEADMSCEPLPGAAGTVAVHTVRAKRLAARSLYVVVTARDITPPAAGTGGTSVLAV